MIPALQIQIKPIYVILMESYGGVPDPDKCYEDTKHIYDLINLINKQCKELANEYEKNKDGRATAALLEEIMEREDTLYDEIHNNIDGDMIN